jgi:hypothetical protein
LLLPFISIWRRQRDAPDSALPAKRSFPRHLNQGIHFVGFPAVPNALIMV